MKICMVNKYPPIEGGISSGTYWLSKKLGEKGHEIHIVTNALEVEDEYREMLNTSDPSYCPKNVFIHSTDPSPTKEANPSHIPFSKMYCEKLANLTIETIEDKNIEVIDSGYLIPYCVSGYLAKSFTGIPQIVRHGGSDLQRLYPSPYLNPLLTKVLKSADAIVTNNAKRGFFEEIGISPSRIYPFQKVCVDAGSFNPNVLPTTLFPSLSKKELPENTPVIGFIGKITHNFENKGLCELLQACREIEDDFLLLFVANGKKLDLFKQLINDNGLEDKSIFVDFVPPWEMPAILKSCSCILALEKEPSQIYEFQTSIIPFEALATGRCILLSNSLHKKEPYHILKNGKDALMVNLNNPDELRRILLKLIKKTELSASIGRNGYQTISEYNNFEGYVDETVKLYQKLV